jgi:hypothetical protein
VEEVHGRQFQADWSAIVVGRWGCWDFHELPVPCVHEDSFKMFDLRCHPRGRRFMSHQSSMHGLHTAPSFPSVWILTSAHPVPALISCCLIPPQVDSVHFGRSISSMTLWNYSEICFSKVCTVGICSTRSTMEDEQAAGAWEVKVIFLRLLILGTLR